MITCKLCNRNYKAITNTHLKLHNLTVDYYIEKFGNNNFGYSFVIGRLPKSDPRYIKWREGLKNRPPVWITGKTKFTDPRVAKISQTFKRKGIDNFRVWRERMKRLGLIKSEYPDFIKNGGLAELIGVAQGDGHIQKFPRTERLIIAANSNNIGFVQRYFILIKKIFKKEPKIMKSSYSNCTRISIYQNNISKRLGIPTGDRSRVKYEFSDWIFHDKSNIISYLRGLYEAEGSFCVHKPTSTYKLLFSNKNKTLLNIVFTGLIKLGFHPHQSNNMIQLSRKEEVYRCKDLLGFRDYNN